MNLWLLMMDMGCVVYDWVYVIKNVWMSERALHFNHNWIVEVLLALPGVVLNGVGIACCYWWGDGTCCAIGWGWVWLGGAEERGGTRHTRHKPISIIINHEFTGPSLISTLGDSLSQNGQPILAQPNFHNLNNSSQCSPKHKLFSDVFLVSYDKWDL